MFSQPIRAPERKIKGDFLMKQPTLVIMAAGLGSRFGGCKQITPVDGAGHVIIDYSIYDAVRAGFGKVVCIIKPELEGDFRSAIGDRIAPFVPLEYAYQTLDKLPKGYAVPEGRAKPWGTGHAVLCCKELIDAPFAVINADDYYGASAFQTAYDALKGLKDDGALARYMMVGYQVENTLSDNGHVSRGVCTVDRDGHLTDVCERTHIIKTADGPLYTEDGETYHRIPQGTLVSMNMWGFTPSLVAALERDFPAFLARALRENPQKAEFFLPTEVNDMLARGEAVVDVLSSRDRWHGVTYQEDKPVVTQALRQLAESGLYPTPLWQ